VEKALILRKHGRQRNTKEQMECGGWIHSPGRPIWNRDVPCARNSNCDPRKRQPISKVHKKGDKQLKVA
jgi:hypothetical protein